MDDLVRRRNELRKAVRDCKERRMSESSKWAALQLRGMRKPDKNYDEDQQRMDQLLRDTILTLEQQDAFDLALEYFDNREYHSSELVLKDFIEHGEGNSAMKFVYFYSKYLKGLKQRAERGIQKNAKMEKYAKIATDLNYIQSFLERDMHALDGFLLYLLGIVLLDKDDTAKGREVLVMSVTKYPCNWSAWKALLAACPDFDVYSQLELPDHFMTIFFRSHACVEFQKSETALEHLHSLSQDFPSSNAFLLGIARARNDLHDSDEAQRIFEDLIRHNPNIIDGMDIYSNLLYVKEDNTALSTLARRLAEQDPYCPESCCVIANYYSFRGEHDKAVIYFKRALKLNPNFLSAWTLMGHEFVELKNPPAAIEAYRKAVSINPNDYRAWYGLGQTYELVNMPHHALHYYSKAILLRPKDSRIWNAMGHCYGSQALMQVDSAIRCYKRALPYDKERVAMRQLATLYHNQSEFDEAALYYKMILERAEEEGLSSREDAAEALNFLAEYYKKSGKLDVSRDYYTRLLDYGMPQHREVAKISLKEIQEMIGVSIPASPGSAGMSTPGSVGMTPTTAPR